MHSEEMNESIRKDYESQLSALRDMMRPALKRHEEQLGELTLALQCSEKKQRDEILNHIKETREAGEKAIAAERERVESARKEHELVLVKIAEQHAQLKSQLSKEQREREVVLQNQARLSSALAKEKAKASEKYNWTPDQLASDCRVCSKAFTWIRRKHHCRSCGSVICSDCSMYRNNTRICTDCGKTDSKTDYNGGTSNGWMTPRSGSINSTP